MLENLVQLRADRRGPEDPPHGDTILILIDFTVGNLDVTLSLNGATCATGWKLRHCRFTDYDNVYSVWRFELALGRAPKQHGDILRDKTVSEPLAGD